ncbi:mRNA cap guanine-N7 methyltransferase, partial [Thalictrum thalictroides]
MKRGYDEPASSAYRGPSSSSSSSSTLPPKSKQRLDPVGVQQFLEGDSTRNLARKVADHYSARTNQTLEEREASPIIHLKKLNNW